MEVTWSEWALRKEREREKEKGGKGEGVEACC